MERGPAFVTTFISLLLILLCFFVFLNSISEINPSKKKLALHSVQTAFPSKQLELHRAQRSALLPTVFQEVERINLENKIPPDAKSQNPQPVKFEQTQDSIVARIPSELLFHFGDEQVRAESLPFLKKLTEQMRKEPLEIQILVESDDVVDSWAQSLTRASSLFRLFVDYGMDAKAIASQGRGITAGSNNAEKKPALNLPSSNIVTFNIRLKPDSNLGEASEHAL